eukprot:10348296-Lingulodinium_polyedra.AAC.1
MIAASHGAAWHSDTAAWHPAPPSCRPSQAPTADVATWQAPSPQHQLPAPLVGDIMRGPTPQWGGQLQASWVEARAPQEVSHYPDG